MRKYPHRNHGPWKRYADGSLVIEGASSPLEGVRSFNDPRIRADGGRLVRIPARRRHGIFKEAQAGPLTLASAKKRARLYAHASARERPAP
jgi:hypothetical protein